MTFELVPIGEIDRDLEMSWAGKTMGEFGDLFAAVLDCDTRMPRFPICPDDAQLGEDEAGKEIGPNDSGRAYVAAVVATQSTPGAAGKVPAFKFCTNDWWRVSEDESRILATEAARLIADSNLPGWRALTLDQGEVSRRRWNERLPVLLAFLTACATTGGFQVA